MVAILNNYCAFDCWEVWERVNSRITVGSSNKMAQYYSRQAIGCSDCDSEVMSFPDITVDRAIFKMATTSQEPHNTTTVRSKLIFYS